MRVPLSLLKKYIDVDLPIAKLTELLTLTGLEVESVENQVPPFDHVVVGKVETVNKHPNADSLVIASVNDGKETVQVVCGAPNCREGLLTAFAKIGAHLTEEGKTITIKKSKLRGIESFGMLLSEKELSLSENHEGILELPSSFTVGSDLSVLADPVLLLSLTPNLGHCYSIIGVARELAAQLNKKISYPEISFEEGSTPIESKISVSVLCPNVVPRYALRLLEGIEMVPSPFWLKKALLAYGMRPINVIVDVLNFTMIEMGQPLHGFDYDTLEEKKIEIQQLSSPLEMLALDHETKICPSSSIVISNHQKAIALGGIIGEMHSSIKTSTKNVLIESAIFDPLIIRKTSSALMLRTESSMRFEKGCDRGNVITALNRACSLIQRLCGGKIAKGAIDTQSEKITPRIIPLRPQRANSILGTKISLNEMISLLQRLDFEPEEKQSMLEVTIPTFRNDIHSEIDLIEEVGRLYGYNSIEKKSPYFTISHCNHSPVYVMERKMKNVLMMEGLQEWITPDLISPKMATTEKSSIISVQHTKSIEHSILRSSYLSSFLEIIRYNTDHQNEEMMGFEIGRLHFDQEGTIIEKPAMGMILTGNETPKHWSAKERPIDFYTIKGIVENLMIRFSQKVSFHPSAHSSLHPSRQAAILLEGKEIGIVGEVHPLLVQEWEIKNRVLFFAELDTTSLISPKEKQYLPYALYPFSSRDWTLSLKKTFPYEQLSSLIEKNRPLLLEDFYLLDIYRDPAHSEMHNMTIRFIYRDTNKTVSYDEVERNHQKILQKVSKNLFQ
ncbi:MAG: phenylalanine--tRNA ligase subunit beta [Parachlamydiales bacterium]|nr:phenylalanine--tRNA ligase subunit beta [Parachlamydiales bacterium]